MLSKRSSGGQNNSPDCEWVEPEPDFQGVPRSSAGVAAGFSRYGPTFDSSHSYDHPKLTGEDILLDIIRKSMDAHSVEGRPFVSVHEKGLLDTCYRRGPARY